MPLTRVVSADKTCGCDHSYFVTNGHNPELAQSIALQLEDMHHIWGAEPEVCRGKDFPAMVERIPCPPHGHGLRALRRIAAGEVIAAARCAIKLTHKFTQSSRTADRDHDFRYTKDTLSIGKSLAAFTDVLMCPSASSTAQFANLPRFPDGAMNWTEAALNDFITTYHNCCLLTITNQPFYALVACRTIEAGEDIAVHYGPWSAQLVSEALVKANAC